MPKSTRRTFVATAASAPALSAFPPPAGAAATPGPGTVLSSAWTPGKLAAALVPRSQWKPFATASDRTAWEGLPDDARKALLAAGESALGAEWPSLPATVFLGYVREGNRSKYERIRDQRRNRLRQLVVAECVEGKGRFLDEILNGIWLTCEETFWGVPAHLGLQKAGPGLPDATEPVVDLFAAETSSQLAWTDYLLAPQLEKLSPLLRKRIHYEIDRRILTPCFERVDFWWMGLDPKSRREAVNNWNPWINSNWLASVLLVEQSPERRSAAVHKILRSLDRFLAGYYPDGGCDEGPGYWGRAGASLFDNLDLLHSASKGAIDYYKLPLVGEIGRYICRAHIYNDWFINFADASARVSIPADLVFRYGRSIGDPDMQKLGAWAASKSGPARGDSLGRQLAALFDLNEIRQAPLGQALLRDSWMPGIQVMAARLKKDSPEGLYLAAQGGHNAESHNHNDVGNFIVYSNGSPAIIDIGVETYSAKTFSSHRYDIWTMQSAWHNLPTVDGVMQAAGRQYAAREVSYRSGEDAAEFSLNIERAYPPEAGIASWRRRLRLDRAKNEVEVRDAYRLKKAPLKITLTLMTPRKPQQVAAGELALGDVSVKYDEKALAPNIEEVKVEDGRLRGVWGDRLYRILLTAEKPPAGGEFTVTIRQPRRAG